MKEKTQKKMKKSTVIITITACSLAIGIGVAGGFLYGQEYFYQEVNYGKYTVKSLEDDVDAMMTKYENTDPSNYLTSFKPHELVNIAIQRYKNFDYTRSCSTGSVLAAGVTQLVRSGSVKNKDKFFNESLSASSMKNVAKRFYQQDGNVDIYRGTSNLEATEATWDEASKTTLTIEKYEESWGRELSRPLIYIISSKTIVGTPAAKMIGEDIVVSLKLDKVKSVIRYVKQMVSMSELSKDPTFNEDVQIQFTLSKDLVLKKTEITEQYTVVFFGKHASLGTIEENFEYSSEPYAIPSLSEHFGY